MLPFDRVSGTCGTVQMTPNCLGEMANRQPTWHHLPRFQPTLWNSHQPMGVELLGMGSKLKLLTLKVMLYTGCCPIQNTRLGLRRILNPQNVDGQWCWDSTAYHIQSRTLSLSFQLIPAWNTYPHPLLGVSATLKRVCRQTLPHPSLPSRDWLLCLHVFVKAIPLYLEWMPFSFCSVHQCSAWPVLPSTWDYCPFSICHLESLST